MSTISMACGVVDTEQAQEAFDLKEQVLTIQVEEIDPLIDQIFDLDRQIESIEREIEGFERQREKIYDQGRDLGNEFEREMKDRFSMVFEGEEQAHRAFEDALEGEWIALEKKRKKIEPLPVNLGKIFLTVIENMVMEDSIIIPDFGNR